MKTVVFDELPSAETAQIGADQRIGGLVLPTGGVAVQIGRLVAWTNAAGKKIGLAQIPLAQAGMRLYGTWADGSIGLISPNGSRLARIPWDWAENKCP